MIERVSTLIKLFVAYMSCLFTLTLLVILGKEWVMNSLYKWEYLIIIIHNVRNKNEK